MRNERGAGPVFVAIAAIVIFGVGIFLWARGWGPVIWEETHAALAKASFLTLKADDADKFADEMLEVWKKTVEETAYPDEYNPIMPPGGVLDLRPRFHAEAKVAFRKAREAAAADFEWHAATYDGPHINKVPKTANRLLGFYCRADGVRYYFKYLKRYPGLYYPIYRGRAKD